MSSTGASPWQYFKVTRASDFVVHVEINRPGRLNAFIEPYVRRVRPELGCYAET